ncbi:hypothetical protein CTI12_AA390000 [Artemisia annua]|uniref:CCHC-type domain-containing protein n=1 Tax=Artemisia annua TaxID=35608 RepID=A0A2U1MEA6_ARTAN|nr:hypothetical protein CTI12_AA390000 [Artemisia annua]
MSTTQDTLAAGSDARPHMLYRGNYVQWSSRFMNVLMGYKERKLLINSIKHGPYKQLQTEDDLSPNELAQFEAYIRAKNLILYWLSNDIYNAIDSNLTAHDLWKALELAQLHEESLEDAYIRFNKLINEMNRHNLKRSNIEQNTMFLTNLQPEWRRFTIAIRQNQDLTAKDINNLFDLLKHNQKQLQTEDDLSPNELAQFEADIRAKNLILYWLSNDIYNAIDSNLTAHDLWKALELAQLHEESLEDAYIRFNKLINEMNRHNLKRSNIEQNTMFLTNLQPEWRRFTIAIRQNQDLTAKDINNLFDLLKHNQIQRTFYKRPTNNNLQTTSAPTAMNKRQDIPPRGEIIRQGAQKNDKNDGGQNNQEPKCFGCGQHGHFAKNYPNGKVRNKAYYRQKMLLAGMEEKGKLLSADENDFMVDTNDKGEILETNMVYMASLEKVDFFEAQEEETTPSYDTDA